MLGLFICMCIAVYTFCCTQHNTAQYNFPCYPPDNHHCWDTVYLGQGGT